jgi:hypothetical protein
MKSEYVETLRNTRRISLLFLAMSFFMFWLMIVEQKHTFAIGFSAGIMASTFYYAFTSTTVTLNKILSNAKPIIQNDHDVRILKDMGYVAPYRWRNTEAFKTFELEQMVACLTKGGDEAFTRDRHSNGGVSLFLVRDLLEEPFKARNKWTVGEFYRDGWVIGLIYAFRDPRDAVEFCLKYF